MSAAGWYPDANDPGQEQYWDGAQWTDARRPRGAPKERGSTALVVVAYVSALLLPILGFILGLVLLVRRQTVHGLACVLLSIAVGLAACAIAVGGIGGKDYPSCADVNAGRAQPVDGKCDPN